MRYLKLIRINQWIKNILIFSPLIITGSRDVSKYLDTILHFFFFSIIVSGTYIINDLLDVDSDMAHPVKKNRPIASGDISIRQSWIILSVLIISGISFFILFSIDNILFPILYIFLTLIYSYKVKYIKYFDLFLIILLFTLRIFFGGAINNITISIYLIIFIVCISGAIITSKKISIYKDKNIGSSKVRNFLIHNYTERQLILTLNIFSYLSLISYGVWLFLIKLNSQNIESFFLYLGTFLLLYFLIKEFIRLSNLALTEDIISISFQNKQFFTLITAFIIFYLLGILFETI